MDDRSGNAGRDFPKQFNLIDLANCEFADILPEYAE